MSSTLAGPHVAIVTGASRGIGRATAIELSRRGYQLAISSRSAASLEQTRQLLANPDAAFVFPADVTSPDAVQKLIDTTASRFARIDALVNIAGLAPAIPAEQMSPDQWHQIIDTNLSSAFYTSRAVWPHFKAQSAGVIVNLSSPAARDPFPGFAAYAAAKAGLNLLSLVLAREGAPHNIRVHAIAPSATETEMFRALLTPEQFPPEKTLDPSDVANLIALCLTGDLQYTSGEVIYLSKSKE